MASGGWACGACTFFHDDATVARCAICNTPRDYAKNLEKSVEKKKAEFEKRFGKELVSFFIPYPEMKGCNSGETAAAMIIQDLWLSGSHRMRDLQWLQGKNVKAILNCAGNDVVLPSKEDLDKAGVKSVLSLPIDDTSGNSKNLRGLLQDAHIFIQKSLEQGRAVAVNCSAGVSRSSTVVISFLLLHRNLTLRDAFTKVRSKRKYVYPNKGFWQLLIDLERGKNSSGRSMQHNNHTGQKCEGKNSADVTDFEAPETSVPMSALCMHAESNPFS
eukprot:jgi/Bigna1/78569/fgenesh1_pg.55_\